MHYSVSGYTGEYFRFFSYNLLKYCFCTYSVHESSDFHLILARAVMTANTMLLFGSKDNFGIAIKPGMSAGMYYLRIHINGNQFGHFKRSGRLIYAYNSLARLHRDFKDLYEPCLESMSPDEFFGWLLAEDIVDWPIDKKSREFARRHKHVIFLGDQMDEFPSGCFVKDDKVFWNTNVGSRDKNIRSIVKLEDVIQAIKEFTSWYEDVTGPGNNSGPA